MIRDWVGDTLCVYVCACVCDLGFTVYGLRFRCMCVTNLVTLYDHDYEFGHSL